MNASKEGSRSLHGICLHEFAGVADDSPISAKDLHIVFKDAYRIFSSGSKFLTDYIDDSLIKMTKRKFRLMLIIMALLIAAQMPFDENETDSIDSGGLLTFVTIVTVLTLYLNTFKGLTHKSYVIASTTLCLFGNVAFFLLKTCRSQMPSRESVSSLIFNFVTHVFCPINGATNYLISLIFLVAYLSQIVTNRSTAVSGKAQGEYLVEDSLTTIFPILSNIFLWSLVIFIGTWLKYMNSLRLKAAFLCLGQGVQAQSACHKAVNEQRQWIEAVVPSQVTREYWKLRKAKEELGSKMWVYCKIFENVSILFADIVGFTKMSSNKQACEIVRLLNDLFNRFDDLCEQTNCEKIGTLGDCYYCVSGCPIPRSDHAACCVEMGLGMCRIIRAFNRDYGEDVNMRVGVHTGRVNAAIIGNRRFRYDVFSYDVIIANEMESSGQPGRVHISETTFQQINLLYNVAKAEDVLIRKEEMSGIAGMILTMIPIKTYFVDQRSSVLRRKNECYGKKRSGFRVIGSRNSSDGDVERKGGEENALKESAEEDMSRLGEENLDWEDELEEQEGLVPKSSTVEKKKATKIYAKENLWDSEKNEFMQRMKATRAEFNRDKQLIEALQSDPFQQIKKLCDLPVDSLTNRFLDPELEWHYLIDTTECVKPSHVHSIKLAPLLDAANSAVIILFLIVYEWAYQLLITPNFSILEISFTFFIAVATITICSLICWTSLRYASSIRMRTKQKAFRCLMNPIIKELMLAAFGILPSLIVMVNEEESLGDQAFDSHQITVTVIALLFPALFATSSARIRNVVQISILCLLISKRNFIISSKEVEALNEDKFNTRNVGWVQWRRSGGDIAFAAELLIIALLSGLLAEENEHAMRLCFNVSREAEINLDESNQAEEACRRLLNNIIPPYVLEVLRSQEATSDSQETGCINYSVSLTNVGVFFACISNFFSSYYREDYKGGENALKLLNTIICTFEDHLDMIEFKDIEKIKTINDCYMVASGLNKASLAANNNWYDHLVALMRYAHVLQDTLNDINEQYIVGADKFLIKIGYNCGNVTAGVIGTTKPMYDIWGDTVNVASRMYSTGAPGIVQVPEYVSITLKDFFDFEYRGEIFVKGKGIMRTFTCIRTSLEKL